MSAGEVLAHSIPFGQRILITGCQGLLGQKLHHLLVRANHVIGVDLAETTHLTGESFEYHRVDVADREAVIKVMTGTKPAFVINTAAMTDVDLCEIERDRCWRVNVLAVENLIRACKKVDAHLLHLSSDYVFDGKRPPYSESDPTSPLGFYGKSKLAGENALRGAGLPWTILRTQVLYGTAPDIRPNFVSFIVEKLRTTEVPKIVDDQRGMPTLADDLAQGLARILLLRKEGIFHIAGRDSVSRWEFARAIARVFGEDPERIAPIKTAELKQKSPRPADSTFALDKIQRELAFLPRGIEEGLREYQRQQSPFPPVHRGTPS
ncbi:MAG TPA: dTDP-4-dehydrorhamnose reductase [bacterium]